MSNVPEELRYTESHEWVSAEDDGTVRVGITDHAQEALGDLVFVELPAVGDQIDQGDSCAVVESVKAASDIYTPLAGEVIEVNEDLDSDPGIINNDPYGDGWLFKLKLDDAAELDDLLDAETYAQQLD
ncbi:glycine cleavage system protein GcvH [Marinihelvus fidelis]|uniref:Glycine cleavage system H protein n=1 Tax=Marinihelvus fidelis TaxID=2613842 RepID=A0A5N0T770_9GAMM|nr:glycine cleavage system protein GcvH [Marinihelvus fidelis]KAA9130833.1 glycine cleavage system protein GcvH [Marinihelvus fidelis]